MIDQLLAGATIAPGTTATGAQPATGASGLASILGATLPATGSAPPQAASLIATLTQQLKDLKDQLDAGQTPDPDALKKLSDTVEALAAMLGQPAPAQPATTAVDITPASVDPLAAVGAARSAPTLPGLAADTAIPDDSSTAQNASGTAAAPVSLAAQSSAAPAVEALATQLDALSQTLGTIAPDLSRKLEALSQNFTSTAKDPQALAQLDQQVAASGTNLTALLGKLLPAGAPAATQSSQPQLVSATGELPLPPVASESKSSTPKSASGNAQDSADTTAPKLTLTATAVAAASATAAAKSDSKSDNAPASAPSDTSVASAKAADATTAGAAAIATTTDAPTAKALPAPYQSTTSTINMGQVAFEMARQFQQGSSRFTIRLDPAELGRIDVKMHVDAAGTVNARLTVDRPETLDMFQRDRGSLEKALTQSGLDGQKTNLEFSLRQNPFAGMSGGNQQQASTPNSGARFGLSQSDDETNVSVPSVTLYRGIASAGGVNLFV